MVHQEQIEVGHRVVRLRPNPNGLELREVEAALGRVVAGGEGPTHRHRVHRVDVLAYDENLRRKVSVVGTPQGIAKLVHVLLESPAGDLMPVVFRLDDEPAHPRLEGDQGFDDRESFPLQVGQHVGAAEQRDRDLRAVRPHTRQPQR